MVYIMQSLYQTFCIVLYIENKKCKELYNRLECQSLRYADLQFVINCPQADIWRCENVCKSAGQKNLIICQNNGSYTNLV